MKEILKLAGVLALITGVAGTALSNVYLLTRDKIDAVEKAREAEAMRMALPSAGYFQPDSTADGFVFYRAYADSSDTSQLEGYVVPADGAGYSSTIRTMVGVSPDMTITGIKVASQQETPGLGTRIEEVRGGEQRAWFQRQFEGLGPEQVRLSQPSSSGRIEAITGATISSRAVAVSVREAVEKLGQTVQ